MLQQALLAASSNNAAAAAAASVGAKLVACLPADGPVLQSNVLLSTPQLHLKQNLVNSIAASVTASRPTPTVLSCTAVNHSTNGPLTSMTHITPNINQLLPSNVDINLFAFVQCYIFLTITFFVSIKICNFYSVPPVKILAV